VNFFEQQKRARRNTLWLIVLYGLAVLGILAAVDGLLSVLHVFNTDTLITGRIPGSVHAFALMMTAAVVLGATVYKVLQLADGGEAVARMVGARQVMAHHADLNEKRLLNVVEEMAIASGTAVPGVYVLDDEDAINAFAAGYEPNEAIVAVTRGALEKLNRDELQGVIGHEFSHILNGDMRINVRMLGILFGITCIGSIGRFLLRASNDSGRARSRGSGAGSAHVAIVALGLGLMIIGAIGVFFARLIKAAVSRQREFLADASSVQFTRNPDGLAGALDRIAVTGAGTFVGNRYAEELSHLFFGQSIRMYFSGWMDTHPPLEERIRRVRPGFQRGSYRARRIDSDRAQAGVASVSAERGSPRDLEAKSAVAAISNVAAEDTRLKQASDIAASVGNPGAAHMRYAHGLLESVPPMLRILAADAKGAQALALALVLAPDEGERSMQIDALERLGMETLASAALAPAMLARRLGPGYVLPLFDLAAASLRSLSAQDRNTLLQALSCAVEADRKVSLQEFVLLAIAERRLQAHAARARPIGKATALDLATQIALALSLLARAGHTDEQWAQLAFERAATFMRLGRAVAMKPWADIRLDEVRAALDELRSLSPEAKARLLEACVLAVTADETIDVREAQLVSLFAAELELPLPPILDTRMA
jgi:Zn-dependent protease with chaperone function